MLIWGLVVGTSLLVLLFLRFVQPEVIYALREQSIAVQTNRAFLALEKGEREPRDLMSKLLIKDFRHETRLYDDRYVLERLVKLRELYRLQGHRAAAPGAVADAYQARICITELANLLGNLPPRNVLSLLQGKIEDEGAN